MTTPKKAAAKPAPAETLPAPAPGAPYIASLDELAEAAKDTTTPPKKKG